MSSAQDKQPLKPNLCEGSTVENRIDRTKPQSLLIELRALLDQIGTYIFTKDTAGRYTYVNHKVQELFADTYENIIGKDDSHFFDLELANELLINDRLVIDHGKTIEQEERTIVKSTDVTKIYWTIKKPLLDEDGQIIGLCGISTDITDRKTMEDALQQSESHLRLSQLVGGVGSWEADLVNNKQTWSESCASLLGLPESTSRTWEDFLAIVHTEDRRRVIEATHLHLEQNNKYDVEYRLLPELGKRWLRSVGEAERDANGKPTLMRGIVQDITERKLAQTQLEQSLSLLQATVESTNDAVLVVDLKNNWVLHNSRFVELWQIPDNIFAAKDDTAAVAYVLEQLQEADSFVAKILELYATPELSSFDVLKFKNGTVIERYSMPQRIKDKIVGRVWSFRDVTAHEQAKQALNQELEKNRALLHNASDGIHILDFEGNIIEVSESFCTMLGYQRQEMIGMNVTQWDANFVGSDLVDQLRQQFTKPIRSQFETRHRRKDGTVFDVEISGYPLELDGKPALFNSSRDISERLRIEKALRLKERYQKALLDNFPFAVWLKDTESRLLSVNSGFAQTFGANSAEDLVGKTDFDIAPSDMAEKYRADDCEVLASRQNKNVEELIFTEGEFKWFETYKAPVIAEDNQLLGTVGFARDITARKQAEENLHLAASVFTFAREAIIISQPNGEILNVNAAFSRITGYSREEVLGRTPRILHSGLQGKEFYETLWQQLVDRGYWQGEVWNRRKNGEVYAEMLTISAVYDSNKTLRQYVALFTDITSQKEHQKQLEHIAHFDALTNLPNRVLLADHLILAMTQSQRRNQPLAVVYLDLDGFKAINDSYGHEAGDQLLMIVASRMKHAMRDGDTLARLGGDEFVAVFVDLEGPASCIPMLDRLLEASSKPVEFGNLMLQVSASLGVTFYPQRNEVDADQLLRQSDQAMYQAKLTGKNRYHIFDAERDASIRSHHELIDQIQRGLVQNEFVLYYQPKVNLRSHQVIGVEALIRWSHPENGMLLPMAFLPKIEDHPLTIQLGEWVINTALTQIEHWQLAGLDIPISVNICGRHLQQENFVERLTEILALHPHIAPSKLELEILETSALEDISRVFEIIERCRGMGIKFALDDFGTGYSSLTYLKRLPVTQIKIDQSFVRDMLDDPDDLSILDGILGLARAFNREVIAEGLETEEHGEALLQLGCNLAQGYGIARPMPADKLPEWMADWCSKQSWSKQHEYNSHALPLLFARAEHRVWLKSLQNHLFNELANPRLLDHQQCRLGTWLKSKDLIDHEAQTDIESIRQLHLQLHAMAAELVKQNTSCRKQTTLTKLDELQVLQFELLTKLQLFAYRKE
jgi:diguanylate cyclase (GGDEF)-like protein/PAS domain S-box-containing protein